eukprot:4966207-Amphidinium_carterae.1
MQFHIKGGNCFWVSHVQRISRWFFQDIASWDVEHVTLGEHSINVRWSKTYKKPKTPPPEVSRPGFEYLALGHSFSHRGHVVVGGLGIMGKRSRHRSRPHVWSSGMPRICLTALYPGLPACMSAQSFGQRVLHVVIWQSAIRKQRLQQQEALVFALQECFCLHQYQQQQQQQHINQQDMELAKGAQEHKEQGNDALGRGQP